MQLPVALLNSLESVNGFDRIPFVKLHDSGEQVTSFRINPFKLSGSPEVLPFGEDLGGAVPWTAHGYYLASRPSFTFDPLFHAGCYYVQEASSMFLEQALKQTVDLSKPLRVLDLCAAPGGKSTHLLSLISKESLLVSNEVIRSRANILNDNIVKWGCSNVVVTNNDPRDFQRLENYFDVIIVDAPCSGSGLFRREPDAIEEWSEQNVALCSQRQQRILADVLPSLKSGGVLIYSTCSYSKEEDEQITGWLVNAFKVESLRLKVEGGWGIVQSDGGYRFWPDKIKGEGFFIACFSKETGSDDETILSKAKTEKFSNREMEILDQYMETEGIGFIRNEEMIHALPVNLQDDIIFLLSKLKVINSGTRIGEIMKDKLVPDHALAMSNILSGNVQAIELDRDNAILYLKRKDIKIEAGKKGWAVVTHQDHPLGWINILPNRINNYYPKELRILKD